MTNVVDHPNRHTVHIPELVEPRDKLLAAMESVVSDLERDNVILPASGYALIGALGTYMLVARETAERLRLA